MTTRGSMDNRWTPYQRSPDQSFNQKHKHEFDLVRNKYCSRNTFKRNHHLFDLFAWVEYIRSPKSRSAPDLIIKGCGWKKQEVPENFFTRKTMQFPTSTPYD